MIAPSACFERSLDRIDNDIPVEIVREAARPSAARRDVQGSLREGFTSEPVSAPRNAPPRPIERELPAPAYTRRSASVAASLQANSGPPVRDRIQFPQQALDTDWDIPAFQRRNGGGG